VQHTKSATHALRDAAFEAAGGEQGGVTRGGFPDEAERGVYGPAARLGQARSLSPALSPASLCLYWQDGASPVYIALKNGHVDVVRLLIGARADIHARTKADTGTHIYTHMRARTRAHLHTHTAPPPPPPRGGGGGAAPPPPHYNMGGYRFDPLLLWITSSILDN
jgi:hypothetical protein